MAERWRYFLTGPELLEQGLTRVYRLREGAPLLTLELAGGRWQRSDAMWRQHYLGSTDDEFHEVTREEAEAVLRRYLETGWYPRIPDLDDPGPDESEVAAARAADEQADAAWRDVRTPPGVEDLDL